MNTLRCVPDLLSIICLSNLSISVQIGLESSEASNRTFSSTMCSSHYTSLLDRHACIPQYREELSLLRLIKNSGALGMQED
jgi:hypothetical protein